MILAGHMGRRVNKRLPQILERTTTLTQVWSSATAVLSSPVASVTFMFVEDHSSMRWVTGYDLWLTRPLLLTKKTDDLPDPLVRPSESLHSRARNSISYVAS